MENELPKGWVNTKIKDVYLVVKEKGEPNEVPYLEIGNVITTTKEYLLTDKASVKGCVKSEKGDVLVSRVRPTRGAVTIIKENNLLVSSAFTVLRNKYKLSDKYLFHFLSFNETFLNYLGENCTGTMYPTVSEEFILNYPLPIGPLAEQQRIVAKLDTILARVNKCKTRLDKIPTLLKNFRQGVLAAAVSGELTKEWREKNMTVKPYPISSSLNDDNENYPLSWRVTELGKLTSVVTSGSRGWAQYYSTSGSLFIRAQNINSDILDLTDVAFVKLPNSTEGLRTRLRLHDILITITGANVTRSAIVKSELNDAYTSQHVALVRLKDPALSNFIYLTIVSPQHGRKELLEAAYGQGKPGINLENIKAVTIALPPIEEQKEIVRKVEDLFHFADSIEVRYQKAKAWFDKLPQSILSKAFRGQLVPQNENDEPASVLLERMKKEKQQTTKPKTKTTSKTKKLYQENDMVSMVAER